MDYEAIKHENRRLKEDLDDMTAELEELAKLKKIVETNLEEALATVVQEREQKHAMKKELDQRLKSDSLYALQSLVNFGLADGRRNHDTAEDSPALKRIESEFSSGDGVGDRSTSPPSSIPEPHSVVGDLFSEIHVTEIRKLEKLLEDVEIQKSELETVLEDVRERLRLAEEELHAREATIDQLQSQLISSTAAASTANDRRADENLQAEIETIRRQVEADVDSRDSEELRRLRDCTAEQEERIRRLEADLSSMSQLATDTQATLGSTQDGLVQVTEDIANLYHLVCEVNGETPNRLTLEHVRGKSARNAAAKQHMTVNTAANSSSDDVQQSALPANSPDTAVESGKEPQQPVSSTDYDLYIFPVFLFSLCCVTDFTFIVHCWSFTVSGLSVEYD